MILTIQNQHANLERDLDLTIQEVKWTSQIYKIHEVPESTPERLVDATQFYAPHERERIAGLVKQCSEGQIYREVLEFYDRLGNHKWVETTGFPLRNADGQIYKLRGTFQDVTRSKIRELEAKNLSLELQQVMDSISETALVVITTPSGFIQSVNANFDRPPVEWSS